MQPTFEYIPVLGTPGNLSLTIAQISGLSTVHGDAFSDRGRLYGSLIFAGGVFTLSLYSDFAKAGGDLVLSGTTSALGVYFDLAGQNNSNMTGRAMLNSYSADDTSIIVIPSFATDQDVLKNVSDAQLFTAYDPIYGLSYFHVDAMRKILASDLPAAVPHLFGKTGLSAFVPMSGGSIIPDLRQLANVDQLREAQAALVKAMAANDSEQTPSMQQVSMASMKRYEDAMAKLAAANVLEQEEAKQEQADEQSVSVGTWTRV